MASRPIDEKIVVMKLDNSDFQRKAAETTSMFGKLKEGLSKIRGVSLGKTAKEMSNISQATKNVNMESLSASVQNVANKFSAMSVIAITALSNIVNKAVDAGARLVKSLSIDQVTEGFQEYETKMGAIQTILANTQAKGTTLTDVKASLEDLNEYADKTIYNFAEMTKNIGLFTNAGLGLEESTSMIKGFSNAAAASGTKSEDAARAAYQLSQGLSSGYIIQQDWMSLTSAGMGNDNMKRDLIAIAKAGGDLKGFSDDDVIGDWKTFLTKKKWLTSDVMSTYLQAMAGDIDKATLKTMGLTEAQADLLIANAKTGEDAAIQVRTLTQMMGTLKEGIGSGWATSFELIFGDFEEATVFWTALSESIGGFFAKSTKKRNDFIKGFKVLGGLDNIFTGIANATKPLGQIFGALKEGFQRIFPPQSLMTFINIARAFESFTAHLKLNNTQVARLTTIFQGVFALFSTVWEITKRLGQAFVKLIPEGTGSGILDLITKLAEMSIKFNESIKAGNGLTEFIGKLGDVLGKIGEYVSDAIKNVYDFSKSLTENLGDAIDWIMDKLAPVGKFLKEAFSGVGGDDILGAGTLAGIFLIVQKIFGFFENASDMLDNVNDVFGGIGDAVNNFANGIKYINLMLIAVALGILAVSLKTLEGIDAVDLAKGITALAVALGVMIGGMMLIDKYSVTGGAKVAATLIALSIAVLIMATALKKISDLDTDELIRGVGGLVGVTGALALAVIAMSKWGGKMGTSSIQLIALAGAVYIMASAVKKMSDIDTGKLWKSIGALSVMLAALAVFLKVVNGTKFGMGSAIGVVLVAAAIHVMVAAIEKIDNIKKDELIKGLTTIGIILGGIAIFAKITSGAGLMTTGIGLLLVAAAINALVGPITTLGDMKWEELAKGLTGMGVALLAVAGAALLMNGGIAGAVGILIVAGALKLLVPSIQAFAEMTWGEIIKGFIGIAGGLTVVAIAAMLLTPAVPSMLAFGGALLLIGVAMLAAGVGVSLFAAGLTALVTVSAVSIAAIISSLGLLIEGLGSLIVSTVKFIVNFTLALVDGILKIVPELADAGAKLILSLLETIAKYQPDFIRVSTKLMVQFMDGMADSIPQLVTSANNLMLTLIETMTESVRTNGPKLRGAILELLGEVLLLFVQSGVDIINALYGWIPGVKTATSTIGANAEKYIRENFNADDAGEDKGEEFSTGLTNKTGAAQTAGTAIANAGKTGAGSVDMTITGADFGQGFANGISSKVKSVAGSAILLAGTAAMWLRKKLEVKSPSRVTDKIGGHAGQGFANGVEKKKKAAQVAATKVASAAVKGFNGKMDDAEYRFKMGKINASQYIGDIEKIKRAYAKYPELVKKANLEIRKIEDKTSKNRAEALKKQSDADKKRIDDGKYYNELSLTEELTAWQKYSAKHKKGSEERMSAEREIYRVKNEINSKLIALNDEYTAKAQEANKRLVDGIKALNDEYKAALETRKNELASFAGLFDKVEMGSDVTGKQLLDNLRGQTDVFVTWANNLRDLGKKGINQGLLAELTAMGPQAAAELAALNSLTAEQLKEYSHLWEFKDTLASNQARNELEGLKKDTAIKIKELTKETAKELELYKKEWITKVTEIRHGVANQMVPLKAGMSEIGRQSIQGLISGMAGMEKSLQAQAKRMANTISGTIKNTLKIKSPSRITEGLAEFAGEGLVVGMANKIKAVASGAKDLALTAKDSLHKFLDGFELEQDDNELHFKAVIDYDKLDVNAFGKLKAIMPDTSFTTNSASATRAMNRQNRSKTLMDAIVVDKSKSTDGKVDDRPAQPIIVQSILDGRIIAESTYVHTSKLMGGQTNLGYAMKGV